MQAFSGGGLGQSAVTGVTEVYDDAGTANDTSDDVLTGYQVETTQTEVTTTNTLIAK
jgi:hypothetical protein